MESASALHKLAFAAGLLILVGSMLAGAVASFRLWEGVPLAIPDAAAVGDRLFEAGDLLGAEREYRMGAEMGHGVPDNSGRLVEIYEQLGDSDGYLGIFREQVRRRPLDLRPQLALGVALTRVGETEEAIAVLEGLRRKAPGFPGVHRTLAFAQLEAGRCGEAEETFREGLALQPQAADLHEGLGRCLKRLGARTEARRSLRRALELDPQRRSARTLLAELDAGAASR